MRRRLRLLPLLWLLLPVSFGAGCRSGGAGSGTRAPTAVAPPAAPAAPAATPARLAAGFRFSTYGPDYDPGALYWRHVGESMASRFPSAAPSAVWIAGKLKGQGCELGFPGTSADPLVQFAAEDGSEEALDLFDRAGFEVWLQAEPGNAPVVELIDRMLERYGHHPSVVGVGIDVEWYRSVDEPEGQAVTDAEARAWLAAARTHDPRYRLFLKHWLIEKMPPTARDGLFFIDDSQILPSLDAMAEEFAAWGRAFAPAPVGFQIGYPTDRPWWRGYADPPAAIGRRLLADVPNTAGLYWVDFTVLEVFPPAAVPGARPRPPPEETAGPVVGVKIYEHAGPYEPLFDAWRELGVDAAFVGEALADQVAFRVEAAERGLPLWLITPVFFDPRAISADPTLAAVTADGRPARDDWVAFVCPSNADFRARRVREVAERVGIVRPHGLSLDFLRHFVFWEKVRPDADHDEIPNACFCPRCTSAFAARNGIEIPPDRRDVPAVAAWILEHHEAAWTTWKLGLVDSMAAEIVAAARAVHPEVRIAIHVVPWRRHDFGGAILRNAGQDFAALSRHADYLSPMTYAHMLRRPPDWVHSVVRTVAESSSAPNLPSIQVQEAYRPGEDYSVAEFESALRATLEPPSRGVVFWSWDGFVREPEKLRVAREVLAASRSAS